MGPGVLEYAVEKARSLAAAAGAASADHPPRHQEKAELARIETRWRLEADGCGSTPRACGPGSPVEPPTPPRQPPEARSGGRGDAAKCSNPPCRDIRRVDGEEADKPSAQILAMGTDFFPEFSDTDSTISVSNSVYRSMTPSPAESPTCALTQNDASDHDATSMTDSDDAREQTMASIADEGEGVNTSCRIVDFCDDIWCPPPPANESDDVESRIFGFDDEDDGVVCEPSCFGADRIAGADGVSAGAHKESVQMVKKKSY